jgi:hypothetical protein
MISLIEGCYSKLLNQRFLSWFSWSKDAAVSYWTKGLYHIFVWRGMLQKVTEPRAFIMILLIEGCCSKLLNQEFLSWLRLWRNAAVRYWTKGFYHDFFIKGCCSKVLNQGFLSWFPWSSDAAVGYWNKGFYHYLLDRGMLQYDTEPRVFIMISLMEGCCSKVLNQRFLSWFPSSRDAAVRYWTKGFYHDFVGRGMLQ